MSDFTRALSNVLPVSVIIPAYNEEASLEALLSDLGAQENPPAEVIVVDAGSTDRTAEIARAYAPWVRLIQVDRAYPGQARNIGVAHAECPIVAFWDGEMRVAHQTLRHLVKPILRGKADFVQGRLYLRNCSLVFWAYMIISLKGVIEDTEGVYGKPPIASCAMRKSLYERVGGCPPYRAAEDILFRMAIEKSGAVIVEVPEAITWWSPQVSFWGLYSKIRTYGRHNLIAGDPVRWFRRLYMYYGGIFLAGILAGALGAWYMGLLMVVLLGVGLTGARSAWSLWRKRKVISQAIARQEPVGISWGYLFRMLPLLVFTIDMASWLGMLDWLILDKLGIAPERYPEPRIKAMD